MRKKTKQYLCSLLLLMIVFTIQNSYGQNLLLLHDRIENKDCIIRAGKNAKVETTTGQIIKGKIIEIKDSSIVLYSKIKTEVKLSNIKCFYYRSPSDWKTAAGIVLGFYSVLMTDFIIEGISQSTVSQPNSATSDNPIPGLAIVSAVAIIPLYAGTYFSLFHKKKYDMQYHYNMSIIKQK